MIIGLKITSSLSLKQINLISVSEETGKKSKLVADDCQPKEELGGQAFQQ
jgi:hypothetical protein